MNNKNFFIFNIISNLNISLINMFKLFIILLFILINIYLIFLEANNPKKMKNVEYMQSGIDGKYFKNLGAIIVSNISLYASILTIKEYKYNKQQIAEAISKDKEALLKAQKELIESKTLNESLKTKVFSSLSRLTEINEQISNNFNAREKIEKSISSKEESLSSISKLEEKNSIIEEIRNLKHNSSFWESELRKSIEVISNESKHLKEIVLEDVKKSFILNPFSFLESFEVIDRIAISILLLNNVILSGLISIVFIFYGDILIEKFKLEEKYPRIASIIKLRRKFQRYYLLLSVLFILSASLSQIIFSIIVLTI